MIFKTLAYIRKSLNGFLVSGLHGPTIDPGNDKNPVILENIAKMEDASFDGANKLVLSLVNLEEESALKNRSPFIKQNGSVEYERPPTVFNLYILFSSNFTDYGTSLQCLSLLISFFQSKNYFSYLEDPPPNEEGLSFTPEEKDAFKVNFDLYTLTFEQLNHLWGSLGGKQVPSVMYKVRVVPIKHKRILDDGRLIERVRREGMVN